MARIRSIKPEFFTSETIAALPISARLTFIGLWTHVDDNGVCQDNVRLITAALWPLEEDPLETLRRTLEDLSALEKEGLIVRYESSGRRFLCVKSWDEHQKVSHPGKPRFPRPDEAVTSTNTDSPESLRRLSGESPETVAKPSALSREQGAGLKGAGSREGAGARRADTARASDALLAEHAAAYQRRPPRDLTRKTGEHIDRLLDEGFDPDAIRAGLAKLRAKPNLGPGVLPSLVNEVLNGHAATNSHRPFRNPTNPDAYTEPL